MVNGEDLIKLKELGFGANIDSFESYAMYLKKSRDSGESINTKTVDGVMKLLKRLKPDSKVFNYSFANVEEAELDEYDGMLEKYKTECLFEVTDQTMVNDIKNVIETEAIDGGLPLTANLSLKGMRHRVIYYRGCLVRVERYGSAGRGDNITEIARVKLPEFVVEWSTIPLVELRGYIVVDKDVYNILSDTCKGCSTALAYLMRDTATEEELSLIDYVYDSVYMSDEHEYAVPGVNSISDELNHLESLGFSVVKHMEFTEVTCDNLDSTIEDIVESMEKAYDEHGDGTNYDCDGVHVRINTNEIRYRLEQEYNNLDIVLRMGKYWDKNKYTGIVNNISWDFGEEYCIPMAEVEPVITVTGDVITKVSLVSIGQMEDMGIKIESEITFEYDEESGNGRLVP